ncbi:MAG: hypothetical protein H6745_27720 [Deltaproteobacteria bacterium]|nr:hypothetical protein [Deltaproteobacteria bacterium]
MTESDELAKLEPSFASGAECTRFFVNAGCRGIDERVAAGAVAFPQAGASDCFDELASSDCGSAESELVRYREGVRFRACPNVLRGRRGRAGLKSLGDPATIPR